MDTNSSSNHGRRVAPRALVASALVLSSWLASPLATAATTTAEPLSPQAAPQGTDAATTAPAARVTPEQIYLGIIEAERKRRDLWRPDPAVPPELAGQWGVQVIGVHRAAGGHWLRFTFRVTDVDKSGVLFDSRLQPYLESEQSGVRLAVPSAAKVGALRTTNRQGNIRQGKTYSIMFANPGARVKPGHKVTVVAGDFRVGQLTVN